MRLTRLYIPQKNFAQGDQVALSADQAHYLLRVLRLGDGEQVILFNEMSGGWTGSVKTIGKNAVVHPIEQVQKPVSSNDIHLLLAPIKKDAWGFVIEKATELGVAALQPVLTDYTQNPRLNDERTKANLIEAAQQCERTDIPGFIEQKKLDTVLASWDKTRKLFVALERSDAVPMKEAAEKNKGAAAILIGPEGGFSQRERDLFLSKDFVIPVSLGPNILRAETAAIAALAVWQACQNY
jgi:16S rRNA (uracil1498-N3)-methyltransferase